MKARKLLRICDFFHISRSYHIELHAMIICTDIQLNQSFHATSPSVSGTSRTPGPEESPDPGATPFLPLKGASEVHTLTQLPFLGFSRIGPILRSSAPLDRSDPRCRTPRKPLREGDFWACQALRILIDMPRPSKPSLSSSGVALQPLKLPMSRDGKDPSHRRQASLFR